MDYIQGNRSCVRRTNSLAPIIHYPRFFIAAQYDGNFNQSIKPGWLPHLTEIWMKKPLVEDFEHITDDSSISLVLEKSRFKIFLVLLLPQIGSSIGTFPCHTWKGIKRIILICRSSHYINFKSINYAQIKLDSNPI